MPGATKKSKRDSKKSHTRKSKSTKKSKLSTKYTKMPKINVNTVIRERKRVNNSLNMTELQFVARSLGIPFGGLTKNRLIRKINYMI